MRKTVLCVALAQAIAGAALASPVYATGEPSVSSEPAIQATAPSVKPDVPPKRWYLHLGPGEIIYSPDARIKVGGVPLNTANVTVPSEGAALFEVGYFLTPHLAASLMAGWPPAAVLNGAGALGGLQLGKVVYGPAMATAHYHFGGFGPYFRPYVGGGAAYAIVFKSKSEALNALHVDNAWGSVLQAGVDCDLTRDLGVFFDARKVYLSSSVTGSAFGAPATATARLDPAILSTGLNLRF